MMMNMGGPRLDYGCLDIQVAAGYPPKSSGPMVTQSGQPRRAPMQRRTPYHHGVQKSPSSFTSPAPPTTWTFIQIELDAGHYQRHQAQLTRYCPSGAHTHLALLNTVSPGRSSLDGGNSGLHGALRCLAPFFSAHPHSARVTHPFAEASAAHPSSLSWCYIPARRSLDLV